MKRLSELDFPFTFEAPFPGTKDVDVWVYIEFSLDGRIESSH